MKLTPHEKKILALIEKNPEIITDTKKRTVIAKENGLSEKTLRNRIGDLKKYGVINLDDSSRSKLAKKSQSAEVNNQENMSDTFSILKKERRFILKISSIAGLFGLIYALIATPFYQSTTTMYPALESESSGGILGSSIKGLAES